MYVVWHPDDEAGVRVFERIHTHFHSDGYSGLAGGAVEVYARSLGWSAAGGPPRPLLLPGDQAGTPRPAHFSAIVPVLGAGLRDAVERDPDWADYLRLGAGGVSDTIAVLPVTVPEVNLTDSVVQSAIGVIQRLPSDALATAGLLERSVVQAVAQKAAGSVGRVRIFVSHASKLQRPSGDRVKTDAKDAVHLARLLRLDEFHRGVGPDRGPGERPGPGPGS